MVKDLKTRRANLLKLIRSFEDTENIVGEDVELDSLDEQIPEELGTEDLDIVNDEEDDASFDVADEEEDEALVELPEDKDDDAIVSEDEEDDDLSFLDDEEEDKEVTASATPEIGDEANGGDPSVSEIVKTDVDVNTDAEVFPTDSEYVAKVTARLDRVADILEKRGMKKMAYRLDVLSDKLEASVRK